MERHSVKIQSNNLPAKPSRRSSGKEDAILEFE